MSYPDSPVVPQPLHGIRLDYERCRSAKGVPMALIPVTSTDLGSDFVFWLMQDALEILDLKARDAHPEQPERWMPSRDPNDYLLFDRTEMRRVSSLTDLSWVPYPIQEDHWRRLSVDVPQFMPGSMFARAILADRPTRPTSRSSSAAAGAAQNPPTLSAAGPPSSSSLPKIAAPR